MALRFMDSFAHYTFNTFTPDTAQLLAKWTGGSAPGSGGAATSAGRFPGSAGVQTYQQYRIYKTMDNQSTWIAGAAFYMPFFGSGVFLLSFDDVTTPQIDLRLTTGGLLQLTRNGTVLSTGSTAISAYTWNYVELKATIDGGSGTAYGRLNGVTECSFSGQTRFTANNYANRFTLGGSLPNAALLFADVYLLDGNGSAPLNDFLGDVRVESLYPSGNGNSSQFTGSDANSVDNYLLVDDPTPDSDTTYVEDAVVGDKDTYAFTNLTPTTGTVFGLQTNVWAKKTDAGLRSMATIARLAGTEVDSADMPLSASYTYYRDIRESKPGGGVWTITDVNSAEFGQKVNS